MTCCVVKAKVVMVDALMHPSHGEHHRGIGDCKLVFSAMLVNHRVIGLSKDRRSKRH